MSKPQCPFLKKACIEGRCRWYIQLLGTDPQKGEPVDKWGCAVEFLPVLVIENAKEVRQTAAAVESARNEGRENASMIAGCVVGVSEEIKNASSSRTFEHSPSRRALARRR